MITLIDRQDLLLYTGQVLYLLGLGLGLILLKYKVLSGILILDVSYLYDYWDIEIFKGVLILEGPLREVPLYIYTLFQLQ